jgi:Protein of unknown function (DUF4435)
MQISSRPLFVFIEGKTSDPFFYGKICDSVCKSLGVAYEQIIANQLPGEESGGKQVLIDFFRYLRRTKFLLDQFQGKTTATLFFLDKDIDDVERRVLRSLHVAYTEYYEVENYLFCEGDVANSAAAAASLDPVTLTNKMGNVSEWRRSRAELWKDWVKLCIFAKVKCLRCQSNFGATSRLNNPASSPTDPSSRAQLLKEIERASGLASDKFARSFRKVSKFVDCTYAEGSHDKIFKGKWYATLMDSEFRRFFPQSHRHMAHFPGRLMTTLAVTLDYLGGWAEGLKASVRAVLSLRQLEPLCVK